MDWPFHPSSSLLPKPGFTGRMAWPPVRQLGLKLKWRIILFAIIGLLLLGPVFVGILYVQNVYYPQSPSGETVNLVIAPGSSVDQIIIQLEEKKLLSQPVFFKAYLKLSARGSTLQAGNFAVRQQLSIKDLVKSLGVATRDQATLRFPEGWRREEMAEYLTSERQKGQLGKLTGQQFSDLALNPTPELKNLLGASLPADASLQGFLFPDTYMVDKDVSAEELLVKMITNYKAKVTPALRNALATQGLSEYQGLIMASIVERESRSEGERAIIAGILLKRLRLGIPLGVDATLQYVLGYSEAEKRWWRHGLTVQDLVIESEYNSRVVVGLPPRPICNPGLAAINSVASPIASSYFYYIHDTSGQVHYAKTLEEHNANVAKYL